MSFLVTALAATFVLAVFWLDPFSRSLASRPGERGTALLFASLGALLTIFFAALVLDQLDIPWTRATWSGTLIALTFIVGWRRRTLRATVPRVPAEPRPSRTMRSPRWGEWMAILAVAAYGLATALLLNLHSDFVYHWGLKAHRFTLARGIDFDYLSAPFNQHLHPDYPLLLPVVYALTSTLADFFDERLLGMWSVLFFALTLVALDHGLRSGGLSRGRRQPALAGVALLLMMFGIGYQMAGGADWLISLAVAASLVPLTTARPDSVTDRQVGLIAAFAAATKIEGMVFAILLSALYLGRRWRYAPRDGKRSTVWGRAFLRSTWMLVLVAGTWALTCLRYGLWNDARQDVPPIAEIVDRLPQVLEALWQSLWTVNWHGFPVLLATLPAFLLSRRWRPVALLLLAQALFYVWVYVTTPLDAVSLIRTSAARLYFHLLPTTLAMLFAVLLAPSGAGERGSGASATTFEDPVR